MNKQLLSMKKLSKFALISCILFFQLVLGENDPYIPIHLDGFNTILFNQEYPHKSLNMYSIIYGNPLDPFPFNQLSYFPVINFSNYDSIKYLGIDSVFRLQASATAGSEIGEPMLNGLESFSDENRDHFTTFATACNIPKTPMHVFFSYRYTDNYSDDFDNDWDYYKKKTGKDMKFRDEGLAHEMSSGYILPGPIITTSLKAISYKRWGAAPLYFSPLYSTGYILSPSLFFTLPKSKLEVDFFFDYHKDYYDHIDFIDYSDEGWDIKWERTLPKGITAQFSHHKDSKLRPSSYANTTLKDTVSNIFIWTLSGNLYKNLRMSGSIDVEYIQVPKFSININTAWDYIPKARSYTYIQNLTPVEYRSEEFESANLHTGLNYTDTIFSFPFEASIWLNYCEKPLWETLEYKTNKTIICLDTISNAAHLIPGGNASYKMPLLKKLFVTLWGNASYIPKNREAKFSLPLNAGADITFGKIDNDSLFAQVQFEYRDRVSIKHRKENSKGIFEYTAPAQTSAYFLFKMPFQLPFFREHIRTNFHIKAGPIRLSTEQRFTEHPRGNLIGPSISLGINGYIN